MEYRVRFAMRSSCRACLCYPSDCSSQLYFFNTDLQLLSYMQCCVVCFIVSEKVVEVKSYMYLALLFDTHCYPLLTVVFNRFSITLTSKKDIVK
jgi:hypothetical protein